jgi:hypothetical protein
MINKEALQQIADLIRAEMDWRNRLGVSMIKKTSRRTFRSRDARAVLLANYSLNPINFTNHKENTYLMSKGLRQSEMMRLCAREFPHTVRQKERT